MAPQTAKSIYEIDQIARLPRHLTQFIVEQNYQEYSPIDHAVWRYIMRQAFDFHRRHAHPSYVGGLERSGIGLERIPRVEEMNEILGRIGWGAAPVDGFIPPAAFMEFQAHRVLVIAADMRQINHIEYTPAPDIIHEAAGHAPIIADPEYAEYLRRFGEIGSKAMSSREDFELYEAIRHLSILKEAPGTPAAAIEGAELKVNEKQSALGEPSEMARLSRLHWWTVEYGLIGSLDDPRLYGAGLLSSIGEAAHCLTGAVRKLPYSVAAADVAFDITTMQPQLFVTPDFAHLTAVLERFADTMAFRRGGRYGLEQAIRSANLATWELSSGLQVSGLVTAFVTDDGSPVFVRCSGPVALAVNGRQLAGHGKETHTDGFSSPIGRPRGCERPLEELDDRALARLGLVVGRDARLDYPGGVALAGRLDAVRREQGRIVLLGFSNCRVSHGDETLFDPSWGRYDLAVGERVTSVFHGAADKEAYEHVAFVPRERTIKLSADEPIRRLNELYREVREIRDSGQGHERLAGLLERVRVQHPDDWLLTVEILEILMQRGLEPGLQEKVRRRLAELGAASAERAKLIANALRLLEN
jgi:phenylalanine-4-hydroxylase